MSEEKVQEQEEIPEVTLYIVDYPFNPKPVRLVRNRKGKGKKEWIAISDEYGEE